MNLAIERKEFYEDRTIGGLYIDGRWYYYVLEDTDRKLEEGGIKIAGRTAIPRDRYKITISWSNRFKQTMPHILDVSQFTGIRIHAGNTPADTEGCPLLGMEYDARSHIILRSKAAFNDFFPRLEEGLREGDVYIEVS